MAPQRKTTTNASKDLEKSKKSSITRGLYAVEQITGRKRRNGRVMYRVKWWGYEQSTWEPAAIMKRDCPSKIDDYKNGVVPNPLEYVEATDRFISSKLGYVERIIKDGIDKNGKPEYLVKWVGWGDDANSMVSLPLIKSRAPEKLEEFQKRAHPNRMESQEGSEESGGTNNCNADTPHDEEEDEEIRETPSGDGATSPEVAENAAAAAAPDPDPNNNRHDETSNLAEAELEKITE